MNINFKNIIQSKHFPTLPYLNPERNQKFFGIVLTLCALSFFGFFAIKPTVSTILKLQKELSDNRSVLSQMETKIKNLTELRKQYFYLQNDLSMITNAITIWPDVPILFGQIQSIAQTSSITITKLQNSEVEIARNNGRVGRNYRSYSFAIAGSGPFEKILEFTKTLVSMERIVNIDAFAINNTADNSETIGFDIQGTAFLKDSL